VQRLHQCLLIATFLPLCWLGMQVVHEVGHVAAAWATGGTVQRVVLHPLAISRTDVRPNPHPIVERASGAVIGTLLPMLAGTLHHRLRWPGAYLTRFFAGFCLVANGAYLLAGSVARIGDAGDLLRLGMPAWPMGLFGAVTIPAGLWLWHGLGPHFGLGSAAGRVSREAAYTSAVLLGALVAAELVAS